MKKKNADGQEPDMTIPVTVSITETASTENITVKIKNHQSGPREALKINVKEMFADSLEPRTVRIQNHEIEPQENIIVHVVTDIEEN